jgi:hypothetical protein
VEGSASEEIGTSRDAKPWWREPPVAVAALSLLVALLFNTVGVWAQFVQSRSDADRAAESRRFTQIGMLTQLSAEARASERIIVSSNLPVLRCAKRPNASRPKPSDTAALEQALGVYDFMAWLFNTGQLDMPSARLMWGPRLIDSAEMARKILSQEALQNLWPQLAKFEATTHMRAPDYCP